MVDETFGGAPWETCRRTPPRRRRPPPRGGRLARRRHGHRCPPKCSTEKSRRAGCVTRSSVVGVSCDSATSGSTTGSRAPPRRSREADALTSATCGDERAAHDADRRVLCRVSILAALNGAARASRRPVNGTRARSRFVEAAVISLTPPRPRETHVPPRTQERRHAPAALEATRGTAPARMGSACRGTRR